MTHIYSFKTKGPCRLDDFLREQLPPVLRVQDGAGVSNSKIRRLIVAGAVRVNGRQCRTPGENLGISDTVSAAVDESRFFYEKQPDDVKFDVTAESVLFEDDSLIIVNKPAFFPTEETITGQRDNMHDAVVRWLWSETPAQRNPPYAGIMHRLDRETSGVLLFTKQRTVNAAVHDMFEQHTARKVYRAVAAYQAAAERFLKGPAGTRVFSADDFLGRISPKSSAGKWGAVPGPQGGLHAHTDFTVLGEGVSGGTRVLYLEARPVTGRTHQIRVHLSSLGLPILGDSLYGGCAAERLFLHARSISFPHPVTGGILTVTAPLPPGFGDGL